MAKNIEASSRSKQEKSTLAKLAPLGSLALLFLISLGAYSEKQKTALKERDGGSCQFPGEHDCGGKLIIHQIKPPAYAKRLGFDPDYADNGITLCANSQKLIYSDVQVPPERIKAAIRTRNIKLNQRKPYWNTEFDRPMSTQVIINAQQAEEDGWEFPEVKRRKKSE